MFFPLYDPSFFLLLPALGFALWAQMKVKATFQRYLRVPSRGGATGAEVARALLDAAGLQHVPVERTNAQLGDHYDPRTKRLRLSPQVYQESSLASIGVAAHETGHALQHQEGYTALALRNSLYPVAAFSSRAAFPLALFGLLFQATGLITLGIYLFIAALAFQLLTLPVEFNASSRALRLLSSAGFVVDRQEEQGVRSVLSAAALTYVAAAAVALTQLIRLLVLRGMVRDD